MIELTYDLFIKVLNSNCINIEDGNIYDFLKMCHVEYYDGMYLIIMNYFGKDIFIGGNYDVDYVDDMWIELNHFEKIDFAVFKNDLYFKESSL